YVRLDSAGAGGFSPEAQARLARAPGVAKITFRKSTPLRLAADKPAVLLSAFPIDRAHPRASLPLLGASLTPPPGATAVWLSEPMARLYGLKPGQSFTLPLGGTAR